MRAEVGPHAVVQCHVSHLYDGGASLYYTFFCREESDPLAQWRRVKTAASDVIAAHGGTITPSAPTTARGRARRSATSACASCAP